MLVFASANSAILDVWRAAIDPGTPVVEARSIEALPACLAQLRPDLVLLDGNLARDSAAHTIDQLLAVRRDTRILTFGPDCDEDGELAVFLAGARGYCLTNTAAATVRRAVDAILRGELWIRRGLLPKLVDSLMSRDDEAAAGATGRFAILTPREIEIARLVGQGASNKRIARELAITESTVKAHLTVIFRKMNTNDRVKLALLVSQRH